MSKQHARELSAMKKCVVRLVASEGNIQNKAKMASVWKIPVDFSKILRLFSRKCVM